MTLPAEFSEWEHLQHTIKKFHNEAVKEFYSEQPDNDIGTSRAAAKHACLIKDDDTANMVILRFWLFWVGCRKMRDNFEPYYGVPVATVNSQVKFKPQITCYFLEDYNDVEPGYRPVEGQLSIRLINESTETISQADLQSYANKVNLAFGQNNGYVWNKGRNLYSYYDKPEGIQFKVLSKNKSHAEEIIQKLLGIAGKTLDQKFLKTNEAANPSLAYPTIPGNHTILNKSYKKPRLRPVANVRFQYASIKIWGLPTPVVLVDKSGYWREAIIPAY